MNIRLAEAKDIDQLIKMRWDMTVEYDPSKNEAFYEAFKKEFHTFLAHALTSNQWFIWVAEDEERIASHIFIELIHKVPRPGRVTYPFAYMTNVYTIPEYRNEGVGSKVIQTINNWIKANNYEFVIVWPSDQAINYYKKNGYIPSTEPMEFTY
ncbi:hypothetical protein Pryu01_01883 [Paraliobacillus ryukyuensis]|uniref:Acetyltransferase (GNAT) family protein n=1 Tax=Paraliobacillus ryukyuensis TaxID=200904 RepID=A0A366DST3_9BACI|nr:GNAT family N-acetyltransferase [Paraliobacillus ryukyuensis]RBO93151.1 acetyltransferase (GNAT) family protein [Paraliobacillus ryukyuensis]